MVCKIVKKQEKVQKSNFINSKFRLTANLRLMLTYLFLISAISSLSRINSCQTTSAYYLKSFFGINTSDNNSTPCVYSGLVEIQSNIKVHFVLIKSRISSFVKDSKSKSLLIWLQEPGKSFFTLLLNSASPFRLQVDEDAAFDDDNIKVFFDNYFNINLKSDILFIDYPGNVGYSTGLDTFNISEVNSGFVSFMSKFKDLSIIDFKNQEVFIIGYSWLAAYFASEVNNDEALRKVMSITKVGLFNTKTNVKYENDYKVDYLRGLGVISVRDLPEFHNLEYLCDYNKNSLQAANKCVKISEYIDEISGDMDTNNTKSSIYNRHGHSKYSEFLISKYLSNIKTMEEMNVINFNPSDQIKMHFVNFNKEVYDKASLYNRNYLGNAETEILKRNRDFHIYYLTGRFDLDNSGEDMVDQLIPSLEKETLGYFKVPIGLYKSYYDYYPTASNIIRGLVKQNEYFTFLIFLDAGKFIPTDDRVAFTYFLNNFFLQTKQIEESFNEQNALTVKNNSIINKSMIATNAIDCPDDVFIQKKDNPTKEDSPKDQNVNIKMNAFQNTNNQEVLVNEFGGCSIFKQHCDVLNHCHNNGYCNESTKGKCICFDGFYGPNCSYSINPLNKFTTASLKPKAMAIYTPVNSMDFLISDNLLFEIEADSTNVVVSIMQKSNHMDIHDYSKHVFFQRIIKKQTVFYLDKDKVADVVIVLTNTDPNSHAKVSFNLFNFNTKSSEFFGPGGFGFIISLILFCVGVALYSSVSVLYKDYTLGIELSYTSFSQSMIQKQNNPTENCHDEENSFDQTKENSEKTSQHYQKLDEMLKSSISNSNYSAETLLNNVNINKGQINFRESNNSDEKNNV